MTDEELQEWLHAKLREIGEHFDCVQLLASTHDSERGTYRCFKGLGNWYAREGMAAEFLAEGAQENQAIAIARKLHE